VWSEITTATRPTPRAGHTAIYDSFKKRMVVVGGGAANDPDLWTLKVTATPLNWVLVRTWSAPPPASIARHTAIYDRTYESWWTPPDERKWINIVYGYNNYLISLRDTTGFEGGSGSYSMPGMTRWLTDHAAVFDPVNDRQIVFGGFDSGTGQVIGETWQQRPGNPAFSTWTKIATGAAPQAGALSAREKDADALALQRVPSSGREVRFAITVPKAGDVSLEIFDVSGRVVWRFEEKFETAGRHEIVWDGNDAHARAVSNGVYFARAGAFGTFVRKKLVLAP